MVILLTYVLYAAIWRDLKTRFYREIRDKTRSGAFQFTLR